MFKKLLSILFLVALFPALFTLVGGQRQTEAAVVKDDKTVVAPAMFTEPPHLDPAVVTSYEEGIVTYQIYETLLKYDLETWKILPNLAESWEISEDATEATFHLRPGVKFSDGTDFNAEAVKYTFERTKAIGRGPSTYLKGITSVEVPGPLTVKFKTAKPWAFWEDVFAAPKVLGIVSPTYVKAHAPSDDPWAMEWMEENTCGTGPYTLVERKRGEYLRLERNLGYWRGWRENNFKTVMVMIVREPAKQKLFFKRGMVDIPYGIPVSEYPALEADPEVRVVPVTGLAQRFITMKSSRPPLDNVNLRKAIAYAIDYESAVKIRPYAKIAQGPLPHHSIGFNKTLEVSHQDLDKARKLMKEAGYKPGELELDLVYVSGLDYQRNVSVLVQSNLAEIGIKLKLSSMPWSTLFPLIADPEKSPTMYIFYAAATFGDPHPLLQQMFHPEALGPAGYNNGYNNPRVGELLDRAERIVDRDERAKIYQEVSAVIAEDQPAIFLWEVPYPQIYRANLKNIVRDGLFRSYYFYDIYRE